MDLATKLATTANLATATATAAVTTTVTARVGFLVIFLERYKKITMVFLLFSRAL
jgi:hypothetical protein